MKKSELRKIIREELTGVSGVSGDQYKNKATAHTVFKQYPYMQDVLEAINGTSGVDYALHDISESSKSIIFYFYQSGHIDTTDSILGKYNTQIQIPGNTEYNFSVSINKL